MTTTTEHDLVTVITEDHRAFERIFKELESGKGGDRHRKDLADHLIAELVRHSIAEGPHPAAPDRPPANRILAPGTAFIDKIRDALSDRAT
ncbi:hypothetical protein ABTX61_34640 [Amycolatopsis japonica]|uniref:hypothetical protein n=1 Tax=Amycolatopsis japonica TaxID=208439 RepID=UPI003324F212